MVWEQHQKWNIIFKIIVVETRIKLETTLS